MRLPAVRSQVRSPVGPQVFAQAFSGGSLPPVLPNLVSEITARGWSGLWADGTPPVLEPDTAPLYQPWWRAAFDELLQPTTIYDPLIPTNRVRIPGGSAFTASEVAWHDYAYAADPGWDGVTNNSTWNSPKPIVQWSDGHRYFYQRYLTLRLRAIHRDGRLGQRIRGVRYTAGDMNGNTVTGIASLVSVSQKPLDWWWEEEFILTLDTGIPGENGALLDGDTWANFDAFPWFGFRNDASPGTDSIFRSVAYTDASPNKLRGPCTRWFRKRAAGVPRCYINPTTGTDTVSVTGWALNNTDRSKPYRTTRVAMNAALDPANAPVTGGIIEGEFCIMDGQTAPFVGLNSAVAAGSVGAVIVTRDPLGTQESCTVSVGATGTGTLNLNAPTNRPQASALIIRDITLQRADGSNPFRGNSSTGGLELWFDNVRYDTRGIGTNLLGPQTVGFITGMRPINSLAGGAQSGTSLSSSGSTQCWALIRGYRGTQGTGGIDAHNIGWSRFDTFRSLQFSAMGQGPDGGIVVGEFRDPNVLTGAEYVSLAMGTAGGTVDGFHLAGLFEPLTDPDTDPGIRIGGDADAGANQSTRHICLGPFLNAGADSSKRVNIAYSGNDRTHELWSIVGAVANEINAKAELFHGITQTGNFSIVHGVGMRGVVTLFEDSAGGDAVNGFRRFSPQYMGLGSLRGLSDTDAIAPVNDIVTDWKGLTMVGGVRSNGTGGGTYTPTPSSILKARIPAARRVRSYDLAGTPITGDDSAGLYL